MEQIVANLKTIKQNFATIRKDYENGIENQELFEQTCILFNETTKHDLNIYVPKKIINLAQETLKFIDNNDTTKMNQNIKSIILNFNIVLDFFIMSLNEYNYLTVLSYENIQKIRIGPNQDGGYVIIDNIGDYDCIIGCGIGNDIEFENEFSKKYPHIPVYCFDGTIEEIPPNTIKNLHLINKNISIKNNLKFSNLHDLFQKYNKIFLKMDIEGAEWQYFYHLPEHYFSKIKQLTLEFHDLINDTHAPSQIKVNVLQKLNKYFYLFHIHANQWSHSPTQFEKIRIPPLSELTYVNRSIPELQNIIPIPNTSMLPTPNLDFPTHPNTIDINLNFPPFNNTISLNEYIFQDIYDFPDYIFFKDLDSLNGDITCHKCADIPTLKQLCDNIPNAVAFNTYGYIKNQITPITDFIPLPKRCCKEPGIYIKKSCIK